MLLLPTLTVKISLLPHAGGGVEEITLGTVIQWLFALIVFAFHLQVVKCCMFSERFVIQQHEFSVNWNWCSLKADLNTDKHSTYVSLLRHKGLQQPTGGAAS